MHKPVKAYFSMLLLMTSMLVMSPAMAVECYTPSPNLSRLGDDYYGLDNTSTLSNTEANQVNALFRAMAGKWVGDMQYRECRGPDRASRIISRTATVKAKIQLRSETELIIDAEKHDLNSRAKRPEHLMLMGKTPTFDLSVIDDNHIVFAERYRRRNQIGKKEAPVKKPTLVSKLKKMLSLETTDNPEPAKQNTSRITETIYEIELHHSALHMVRVYYTNGVYIGEEHWQMQRD